MLMLLWRMKKGLYLWDRKLKGCFRDFYCWFPFAEYAGSLYLMLDYNPSPKGTVAQIICYVHTPESQQNSNTASAHIENSLCALL